MASPEKYLSVDKSPIYDRHEDPDNEEFINDNDPEKKFVPINEVSDVDTDFTEKMDNQEEEIEEHEPIDKKQALDEVRRDIGHYEHEGPDNVALASFHVDHNNEKTISVAEEGLESFRPTDPETIKDAPLEEEFANNNIVTDRKISAGVIPEGTRKYKDIRSNASDNLKTMPDKKVERGNRGLIRKFLDNVWNKN